MGRIVALVSDLAMVSRHNLDLAPAMSAPTLLGSKRTLGFGQLCSRAGSELLPEEWFALAPSDDIDNS